MAEMTDSQRVEVMRRLFDAMNHGELSLDTSGHML